MKPLWQCRSEDEQVAWTVAALRAGYRVHDPLLWLGGVDRPVRTVGQAKAVLRAAGLNVVSAIEIVKDASGEGHETLAWRLAHADQGST